MILPITKIIIPQIKQPFEPLINYDDSSVQKWKFI